MLADHDMRTVTAGPRASVLFESLREIGYSLASALADIVDNAITAGATTVHLLVDTSGPEGRIDVLDDGRGMTESELIEAMRLGSRSPLEDREPSDLGRFGLGLKTASFSQCRRLTVVTRCNNSRACRPAALTRSPILAMPALEKGWHGGPPANRSIW